MSRWKYSVLSVAMLLVHAQAQAQAQPQASASAGTLVVVPAFGEVVRENDLAIATLMIEEQDRDKAQAASRVNVKMKQGTEIVKRADPQAVLKTRGYYTYPVYPEERPVAVGAVARARVPTSWRVGQYLDMKTANLAALPKTIAAVQSVLAVNALNFGLAPDTGKQLDAQRIAATFLNLRERIADIRSIDRWVASPEPSLSAPGA